MTFGNRASILTAVIVAFVGCASLRPPSNAEAVPSPSRMPKPQAERGRESASAPPPSGSQGTTGPAPTWSAIYARYLSPNSEGGCGRGCDCHADVMGDSASAYEWLAARGYIAGAQSRLVSRANSCLLWFGGNMPPFGVPNERAVRDLTAWVAAGAPAN